MLTVTAGPSQFPPISDKIRFPILSRGDEFPGRDLMGCQSLTFFATESPSEVGPVIMRESSDWHLYGDTRWESLSAWIEIDTGPTYSEWSGVLVMTFAIPDDEKDPFDWIAHNGPLQHLYPDLRSNALIQQQLGALRQQAASTEKMPEPEDTKPRYVQSYCIYRGAGNVELVGRYTDLLNQRGIPLSRYRTATVRPEDIDVCRFTLHALFRLNQARLGGMKFLAFPQLEALEPVRLLPDSKNPPWARFHPSRVLRTRPAVRAIPTPDNMHQGMMQMETMQQLMEARRIEATLHTLPFTIGARPKSALFNDGDSCMAAFTHRANGGAIYVLPERLVEEFDNTDCDEIRMKDLKLPFPNLFLKFTPPKPLYLFEGAPVDGCYIVKQGDEFLFSLTSYLEEVDYSRTLSVACLDPTFAIHLPAPDFKLHKPGENTDICINEAVELGIKEYLERNAPPKDDISRTITRPDGTTAHVKDIRAQSRKKRIDIFRSQEPVFRACLNIIVNAACFISFRPEDITEEWDGEPPAWVVEAINDKRDTRSARDRKQHALRTLSGGDYTRIRICGKHLFEGPKEPQGTGIGNSPRTHWRRGHWRRQRHGTGLSMVVHRWIRPTIVKKDAGTPVESRIYDIKDTPPA